MNYRTAVLTENSMWARAEMRKSTGLWQGTEGQQVLYREEAKIQVQSSH